MKDFKSTNRGRQGSKKIGVSFPYMWWVFLVENNRRPGVLGPGVKKGGKLNKKGVEVGKILFFIFWGVLGADVVLCVFGVRICL